MKLLSIPVVASLSLSVLADWSSFDRFQAARLQHDRFHSLNSGQNDLDSRAETVAEPRFLNDKTHKFAVNGTDLPYADFDLGESYSGRLPISNDPKIKQELFFWFFPTLNQQHKDDKEIVIWLNGGPGCSSLLGLFQENGPVLWQPGTIAPQKNPWSWHLLSNMVYIEQPAGVGYSTGPATARNEDELANQFLGFWKNFVDTFSLQGYKIFLAAESYGGMYGPYIASHMLDKKDTKNYNLKGLFIQDGTFADETIIVQGNVPVYDFLERNHAILPFSDPVMAKFKQNAQKCGYTDYLHKYLKFPPSGTPKFPPGVTRDANGTLNIDEECAGNDYNAIFDAAFTLNPCFDYYNILAHCPPLYDPIGDGVNGVAYFDLPEVKKALHVPVATKWQQCIDRPFNTPSGRESYPSPDRKQLPHVIDATKNVMIVHDALDFLLPANGALLGIQNMTWGGKQGFQTIPTDPFYVPYYPVQKYAQRLPAGSGVLGTTHSERGLTFVATTLAGHEGPKDLPSASFRQLEKLLGRIDSLSAKTSFTIPQLKGEKQPDGPLGKGSFKVPVF